MKFGKKNKLTKIILIIFLSLLNFFDCAKDQLAPSRASKQINKDNPIPAVVDIDPSPKNRGLFAEHYPASNERRIDLFMPRIQGLGGGYIGVGTDQNFSFIAKARSECAFLMDFDAEIVKVNRVHLFFWERSQNFDEFKGFWNPKRKQEIETFITQNSGESFKDLLDGYRLGLKSNWVPGRLEELNYMHKKFGLVTFSHSDDEFQYIKKLIQNKRIQAIVGNLLGDKSMNSISKLSKEIDCPIRILYTSNAEEYFAFPDSFRQNILNLNTDEKGVLLRTITAGTKHGWGYPEGEKYPEKYPFHYNIQPLQNLQKWMSLKSPLKIYDIMKGRVAKTIGYSEIEKSPEEVGYIK
jgi:hypothetical protein